MSGKRLVKKKNGRKLNGKMIGHLDWSGGGENLWI
jgi:hypothetical protein